MTDYADRSKFLLLEIEKAIAEYMDMKYAIVCSSARSAIRFSLLSSGVGMGNEVLVSDLVPQELPITVFCTGAKPRLCDVDRQTCAMSFESFQDALQANTKAVIFSQLYGLPADIMPVKEVSIEKGITVIEDSSQALGTIVKGKKAGALGDVGILNFNKFLGVPLGAAVITNDEEIAGKIRENRFKFEAKSHFAFMCHWIMAALQLHSKEFVQLVFLSDKYLYKLRHETFNRKYFNIIDGWIRAKPHVVALWRSNLLTQPMINQLVARADGRYWQRRKMEYVEIFRLKKELAHIKEYLQRRREAAKIYDESLTFNEFDKIHIPRDAVASYKKYPVIFSEKSKSLRCLRRLFQAGFRLDYRYRPLHLSPFMEDVSNSDFKNASYLSDHLLPLPITPNMKCSTVEEVANIVNRNAL